MNTCKSSSMRAAVIWTIATVALFMATSVALSAETSQSRILQPIDETQRVVLRGNTPAPAVDPRNDRGGVPDSLPLEHLRLVLQRSVAGDAALKARIEAMHNPRSPLYRKWLTAEQIGRDYGVAPQDRAAISQWLGSHGFIANVDYRNGYVIDFSGTAGQVKEAFQTELHRIVLPDGRTHIGNIKDPSIPAALAPVITGIATLHDFRPVPHVKIAGPVAFDGKTKQWQPRFTVSEKTTTYHTVGPYDFAAIYDLLPLWKSGVTGKGVTIALIEDTNLLHPGDWTSFRKTFGMTGFTGGSFEQIYPQASGGLSCANPGQNGDEVEAALDVEWASATAPDANVELVACADTNTTSGLDSAILNLLDSNPPDIISDSYGLCETVTGAAEVALENMEEEQAAAEGVTFFIAQGDTGADECVPVESTAYSSLGINSGDNTASSYVVDVGGTDFMAQYDQDANGVPLSLFWSATNDPTTLQSAKSYVPEIPWNDGCTSNLIYTDPVYGPYSESYGPAGFCNTSYAKKNYFQYATAGSGGPSTCFTGAPSVPGVVSGTCKGNPKPYYQTGVPGIPEDGLRDQPDLSFLAADGVWGSFYVECLSDVSQGGAPCTAGNDALLLGGGGTSFAAPAMAGIQALVDQKYGRQGNTNPVFYALAARQFRELPADACAASSAEGALPNSACVFHFVNGGSIATPCGADSSGHLHDCYGAGGALVGELSKSSIRFEPAYTGRIGYNLATGLGSLDATNLFNAWADWSK